MTRLEDVANTQAWGGDDGPVPAVASTADPLLTVICQCVTVSISGWPDPPTPITLAATG